MSGSSISSYIFCKPSFLICAKIFSAASEKLDTFAYCKMSSMVGLVISERRSHRAMATFLTSPSSAATCSSFSSGTFSSSVSAPPNICLTRAKRVRNSSSLKSISTFLISNASAHFFGGRVNEMGTLRLMVAKVFENSASSSPSFKSCIMRGFIPFSTNTCSSFLSTS